MTYPRISIIILNWNGWEDTIECLESLYRMTYSNYNVIVVDNGSKDDSVERIKEWIGGKRKPNSKFFNCHPINKPIKYIEYTREEIKIEQSKLKEIQGLPSYEKMVIIRNEKNYGFAEGNNIAIRYALKFLSPDYILLLNNDTVVDPNFLFELIRIAESEQEIGIVGPKIYYYDFKGKSNVIWFAGGKISWWRRQVYYHIGQDKEDLPEYQITRETDWVSGAALMVKCRKTKRLSLLNSQYYFGKEDIEYCLRVRKYGVKIAYVADAKIWHKVGMSRKKYNNPAFANLCSDYKFIKQNFSTGVYIYHLLLLPIILLRWALKYIVRYRNKKTLLRFLLNFREFIFRVMTNWRK